MFRKSGYYANDSCIHTLCVCLCFLHHTRKSNENERRYTTPVTLHTFKALFFLSLYFAKAVQSVLDNKNIRVFVCAYGCSSAYALDSQRKHCHLKKKKNAIEKQCK